MFLSQMDGFMIFVQDFKEIVGIVGCFFLFFFWGGGGGGGGLNVSAFFLGHLSVIFERDGLGGGVCVGAAVDGGVWINGEGGAVGDG